MTAREREAREELLRRFRVWVEREEGWYTMRHPHEVKETRFTVHYEHDDSPSWHVDYAHEDHDHALVVIVGGGKLSLIAEPPDVDRFVHAVS